MTPPTTTTTTNRPLPSPPFYNISNINNLRDTALYPLSTPHGNLRPGLLFRSAEVSKLDFPGWQTIHALGVGHVFDLRSKPEVDRDWSGNVEKHSSTDDDDAQPPWVQAMQHAHVFRSWVPVFAEKDYSPERLAERYVKYMDRSVKGFVAAYRDILVSGGEAYRKILLYLANLPLGDADEVGGQSKKIGALVHCTAGKDRTGVFFGILFDFLGVTREVIAEEYNLTELGLQEVLEDALARLLQSPGFKKYMLSLMMEKKLSGEEMAKLGENKDGESREEVVFPPEVMEEGRQAALRMVGAKKESMLATLEMVDHEFGGSEKYMRTFCRLNDDDLEKLRRVLIVKE